MPSPISRVPAMAEAVRPDGAEVTSYAEGKQHRTAEGDRKAA
jgi:hypothetical protein